MKQGTLKKLLIQRCAQNARIPRVAPGNRCKATKKLEIKKLTCLRLEMHNINMAIYININIFTYILYNKTNFAYFVHFRFFY